MSKKYEIVRDQSITIYNKNLYRIRSLYDFMAGNGRSVKKGDLGGYVQSENNLSQSGKCWIFDDAKAFDNAIIRDNSTISDQAESYNNAIICDSADILDYSSVHGNAIICNSARIFSHSIVFDSAIIGGNSRICDSIIHDDAIICTSPGLCDNSEIYGNAKIIGNTQISNMIIPKNACILSTNHAFSVGPIYKGNHMTFYRNIDNKLSVIYCGRECIICTIDEFINKVYEISDDEDVRKNFMLAIELAKMVIKLN